jgi:hypothetical protein
LDADDDGDGIPDDKERDSNGDGVPDHLDDDDDGDGIPDSEDDDADGDGMPDFKQIRRYLSGLVYLQVNTDIRIRSFTSQSNCHFLQRTNVSGIIPHNIKQENPLKYRR